MDKKKLAIQHHLTYVVSNIYIKAWSDKNGTFTNLRILFIVFVLYLYSWHWRFDTRTGIIGSEQILCPFANKSHYGKWPVNRSVSFIYLLHSMPTLRLDYTCVCNSTRMPPLITSELISIDKNKSEQYQTRLPLSNDVRKTGYLHPS